MGLQENESRIKTIGSPWDWIYLFIYQKFDSLRVPDIMYFRVTLRFHYPGSGRAEEYSGMLRILMEGEGLILRENASLVCIITNMIPYYHPRDELKILVPISHESFSASTQSRSCSEQGR